jgi:hypothetical protein
MSHQCWIFILSCTALVSVAVGNPTRVLLHDDFEGPSLDPNKWTTDVSFPNFGTPEVTQEGGQVVFRNRGYLKTTHSFDPSKLGGIRITGTAFIGTDEIFTILTRTSAVPSGVFGESFNGLSFRVFTPDFFPSGAIGIETWNEAQSTVLTRADFTYVPGAAYAFDATDDGRHVTLALSQESDPTNHVEVAADTDYRSGSNLIAFHNREQLGSGVEMNFVKVESLRPSVIPLPPAVWMALINIGAMVAF